MGVKIFDLVSNKNLEVKDLKNKIVGIDAFNVLYQFLSSIRGSDGALLQDSNGRVTSHLYGLFSRTMNLITAGVKPVYVFDGKAPDLKYLEQKRRSDLKKEALNKYEIAKQSGDLDEMKKYASRTSRLTQEMIEDAKLLIDSMGVPIVQAPSEGEAQATFMCKQKDVYAVASQDGDSLLFGAPILIKNLTLYLLQISLIFFPIINLFLVVSFLSLN